MAAAEVDAPAQTLDVGWLEPEMQALVPHLSEFQVMAVTLYGEAGGEPAHGIIGVGCVIRNRVKADVGDDKPGWWGDGYRGTVLAPEQFKSWIPAGGATNYQRVLKLARQFAEGTPITMARSRECLWIAHGIISDYARDNVDGATHYHLVKDQPRPTWARDKVPVKQIGGHLFYRL